MVTKGVVVPSGGPADCKEAQLQADGELEDVVVPADRKDFSEGPAPGSPGSRADSQMDSSCRCAHPVRPSAPYVSAWSASYRPREPRLHDHRDGTRLAHLASGTTGDDDDGVGDVQRTYPQELAWWRVLDSWPLTHIAFPSGFRCY